jgi:hypothetical protein
MMLVYQTDVMRHVYQLVVVNHVYQLVLAMLVDEQQKDEVMHDDKHQSYHRILHH